MAINPPALRYMKTAVDAAQTMPIFVHRRKLKLTLSEVRRFRQLSATNVGVAGT